MAKKQDTPPTMQVNGTLESINSESTVPVPRIHDVIMGRRKGAHSHPGNVMLRQLCRQAVERSRDKQAPSVSRREIAEMVYDECCERDVRFLSEEPGGKWRQADRETITAKLANDLRNRTDRGRNSEAKQASHSTTTMTSDDSKVRTSAVAKTKEPLQRKKTSLSVISSALPSRQLRDPTPAVHAPVLQQEPSESGPRILTALGDTHSQATGVPPLMPFSQAPNSALVPTVLQNVAQQRPTPQPQIVILAPAATLQQQLALAGGMDQSATQQKINMLVMKQQQDQQELLHRQEQQRQLLHQNQQLQLHRIQFEMEAQTQPQIQQTQVVGPAPQLMSQARPMLQQAHAMGPPQLQPAAQPQQIQQGQGLRRPSQSLPSAQLVTNPMVTQLVSTLQSPSPVVQQRPIVQPQQPVVQLPNRSPVAQQQQVVRLPDSGGSQVYLLQPPNPPSGPPV